MESTFVCGLLYTDIEALKRTVLDIVNKVKFEELTNDEAQEVLFEENMLYSAWRDASYAFSICDVDPYSTRGYYGSNATYRSFLYFASDTGMGDGIRHLTESSFPIHKDLTDETVVEYYDLALHTCSFTEVDDFMVILSNCLDIVESQGYTPEIITKEILIQTAKDVCTNNDFPPIIEDVFWGMLKNIDNYKEVIINHDEIFPTEEVEKMLDACQEFVKNLE